MHRRPADDSATSQGIAADYATLPSTGLMENHMPGAHARFSTLLARLTSRSFAKQLLARSSGFVRAVVSTCAPSWRPLAFQSENAGH
jgi:hypothetical protein